MVTVQSLLKVAQSFLGVKEGTSQFSDLIQAYNSVKPLPMVYQMKLTDDWCDAFVTVVADKAGASALIGRECGVQRHIALFKEKGIWLGRVFPKPGDVITFDWEQNGWADHIGFVESVSDNWVTTIEGNSNQQVERNRFVWNDSRIMGYARPKYQIVSEVKLTIEAVAREVIQGKWGTGKERMTQLMAAGYNAGAVQSKVNAMMSGGDREIVEVDSEGGLTYANVLLKAAHVETLMSLAREYRILPSLLIVMLHFEGVWGQSRVAKTDHNWGGMTWSPSYVGHPEIKKTRGSQRPASEGGYYIKYASVEDFFKDWVYLLRDGGSYRVNGLADFVSAVKGLFKVGGARYDYAALGYATYVERMVARKLGIDKQNPGVLDRLDEKWRGGEEEGKEEVDSKQKVTVSNRAMRWQTGEKMADWVKGLSFDVLETKEVIEKAYLLENEGVVLGWLMEGDVVGV